MASPAIRVEMDPRRSRDCERLRPGLNRQDPVTDVVDRGIPADPPAHPGIPVDGEDPGSLSQSNRVAADPRAEIHDDRGIKPPGLVAGDELGGRLLDAGRLDPHPRAALELRDGLSPRLG